VDYSEKIGSQICGDYDGMGKQHVGRKKTLFKNISCKKLLERNNI
jgi:hypothetical protein